MIRARVSKRYLALLQAGKLNQDPAQLAAVNTLAGLSRKLKRYAPPGQRGFSVLFGLKSPQPPKGLYLHGGPGRGKTMLMDSFFSSIRFQPKRRVHFHEFMQGVHQGIARARKGETGDPIPGVGRDLAASARLLCLDELHVTDIADAMILGRLFEALFAAGVVVVATSNSAPNELYNDGLNRALFLPFLKLVAARMDTVALDGAKDYRLENLAGKQRYFSPLGEAASAALDDIFLKLTDGMPPMPLNLDVNGHALNLKRAGRGVALATFAELCDRPLGAADYIALAGHIQTLLIDGVPRLGPDQRNEARRFINLVDVLYDHRVRLILAADAEPDDLYRAGDGSDLFARTASRLTEMRSEGYLGHADKTIPPPTS